MKAGGTEDNHGRLAQETDRVRQLGLSGHLRQTRQVEHNKICGFSAASSLRPVPGSRCL